MAKIPALNFLAFIVIVVQFQYTFCLVSLPDFYKFGFYGGDGVNVDVGEFGSECAPSEDTEFLRVAITGNPIVFLGQIYHEIFISSNVQVNFVEGDTNSNICGSAASTPGIQLLNVDCDTTYGGCIMHRTSTNSDELARNSQEISQAAKEQCSSISKNRNASFTSSSKRSSGHLGGNHGNHDHEYGNQGSSASDPYFYPTSLFIVTFYKIPYYEDDAPTYEKNTIQLIISTDGIRTFIIIYYNRLDYLSADDVIGVYDPEALAGISYANGPFYLIPGSCTGAVRNFLHTSNVGRPGVFIFEVDQAPQNVCGDDLTLVNTRGFVNFGQEGSGNGDSNVTQTAALSGDFDKKGRPKKQKLKRPKKPKRPHTRKPRPANK